MAKVRQEQPKRQPQQRKQATSKVSATKKTKTTHRFLPQGENKIKHNYTWIAGFIAIVIMVIICVAMGSASKRVKERNAAYDKQIEVLSNKIEDQEERRTQLDYRSVFITTKQFVEEFAREKLGLIFDDELIFRPE